MGLDQLGDAGFLALGWGREEPSLFFKNSSEPSTLSQA